MKPEILARVQQLLTLAGHPDTPLEEARTAAHQAAKLFTKHHLTIGGGGAHGRHVRHEPDRPRAPWESTPEERAAANRAYEARVSAEKAEKAKKQR